MRTRLSPAPAPPPRPLFFARDALGEAAATADANRARQTVIRTRLDDLLDDGDVLGLPTSPRVVPFKDIQTSTKEITYRYQAMCLLCIAGLGGLPPVSLPLATLDGMPLGLSLVGARGSDDGLLAVCGELMAAA